ncbi:MAG: enoyl-CoA hydratase-related protein [Bacillota bacterium]
MEFILFEKKGPVAVITINRPKQLNAINTQVLKELDKVIDLIEQDNEMLVLVITGAGGKAFVAGADVEAMSKMTSLEAYEFVKLGQRVFIRLERLSKPVLAAINGYALGGGCELALACDIRISGDRAKFGQPEVNLGIIPGFGGTQRLPRLIGKSKAMKLILTGDIIGAEEAYKLGIVDQVVPNDELMQTVMDIAAKIASKAPFAVQQAKAAINYSSGYMDEACDYEASLIANCFATEDQKEGMSAFLAKRKPTFTGR